MTRTRSALPLTLRLECLEDRSVPATFNVTTTLDVIDPSDGKRSLREAINAANTLGGADVIVLSAGVYKIALAGTGENANVTGDFDIEGSVTICGKGASISIIDGQQLDRVFDISGTSTGSIQVVLEKMTIRSGNINGNGGGVRVGNANLVVRDCAVNGNRVSQSGGGVSNADLPGTGSVRVVRTTVARNVAGTFGGGLFIDGMSSFTVIDGTIRRNLCSSNGGGIFAETATLTGCTVSGNSADGLGGGIAADTTTLTSSTVSGNTAGTNGGGLRANTATLTSSTVSGNTAGGEGGGIRALTVTLAKSTVSGNSATLSGGGIDAPTVTLTNSTVSGNSAGNVGGGIFAPTTANLTNSTVSGNVTASSGGGILAATANLTNSTISGNTAATEGGGLFATTATLLNCTTVENFATTGGGLFHNPGGTFSVRNSIVALNLVDFAGTGPDVAGAFTSQGYNLIGDGTGGTGYTNGVSGDMVGATINSIDPKLGPLQNNGGRTKTHALLAGSRAIDAGDNAGVVLVAFDQRGGGFPARRTAMATASRSWTSARSRNETKNSSPDFEYIVRDPADGRGPLVRCPITGCIAHRSA